MNNQITIFFIHNLKFWQFLLNPLPFYSVDCAYIAYMDVPDFELGKGWNLSYVA